MHARPAVFSLLLLAPLTAGAQAIGIGPVVLQLPASTRAIGFGNAYVGVREPEAVFYNPAQLGVRPGVAISAERYGSASTAGAFASTYVFGPIGFGVGAQMLDFDSGSPGYPGGAPNGEQLLTPGQFSASSLVAAVAAEMAYKGIRWGVTGKVAEDRVAGERDGVLLADVGAAKEIGPVTAGVTVQNLGTVAATGSVIACVNVDNTLAGPSTSTVEGSAVTVPTTKPSEGSPSTDGTTGTTLLPDGSNIIDTVDGFTWTTSTPNGVRTSSPSR